MRRVDARYGRVEAAWTIVAIGLSSVACSAWGVGWDGAETIDFNEYATAPRTFGGVTPVNLFNWTPPDGWTDPIEHRAREIAFTGYNHSDRDDLNTGSPSYDLEVWAKQVRTLGNDEFGFYGLVPQQRPDFRAGTLNLRSLDVGIDLQHENALATPATGAWQATLHGYREDLTQPFGTPERWQEIYSKPFTIPVPQTVQRPGGTTFETTTAFATVDVPGWTALDRVAISLDDTRVDRLAIDNIQATGGETHAFFLGAPDTFRIDADRDTRAMRDAMEEMFGMTNSRRVILPDINLNQTPNNATAQIFDALDDVKASLAPGDNFVFHYSGHGVRLRRNGQPNVNNGDEALMLGYNSFEDPILLEDDLLTAYFAEDPIWSQVDKVFVLDACYSGGFWTSTPDVIAASGRENNQPGPTDLATLPRTALLAAAPEARQALSFADQRDLDENGLPGTQDFVPGQGLLTAAVVSALQRSEEGYALADLNEDGLSFRELLEYARVGDTNELFGNRTAFDDDFAVRNMRRWLDRNGYADVSVGWFLKSRFVGYERSDPFDPWATEPIEVDWEPFAAFTEDFGTAGLMQLQTAAEIASGVDGLAGDFDGSGTVEQADLDLILTNWGGQRGNWSNADGFATNTVDQEELDAVLTGWGSSSAPVFDGGVVLPEPAFAGFGLAMLGWIRGRSARPR